MLNNPKPLDPQIHNIVFICSDIAKPFRYKLISLLSGITASIEPILIGPGERKLQGFLTKISFVSNTVRLARQLI